MLALLQQRSIRENIALPSFGRRRMGAHRRARGAERGFKSAIERLQIDTRAASELRRLSGGNQQKVVIARWLAAGFDTLLCFDPTRGIDIGTKRQIYALVRELAASGAAVLFFTSELPEIALTCDRAIVLFGGRVVAEMPVAEADEASLLRAAHGLQLLASGATLMIRRLTKDRSPQLITTYLLLFTAPVLFIPTLLYGAMPDPWQWPWLLMMGGFAASAHLCLSKAYASAEVSYLIPYG